MKSENNISYEKPEISVKGEKINLTSSFPGSTLTPGDLPAPPFMPRDCTETTSA